jgi:hypothetical protein
MASGNKGPPNLPENPYQAALGGDDAEFSRRRPVPLNPDVQPAKGQWDKLDWFPERIVAGEKVAAEVMDRALALDGQHAGPQRELCRQLEQVREEKRKHKPQ